ncbi:putative U4/U6 small nuclear ribonuclear protein [Trypanosoma theileri]|uniref:Putative U4/U6 small nuclear ribonuclear protein n=1 Tax=Trypanosoma theileri TaxID=67003 RepID=A0A1X0NPX8_9TRYP|nr:putative U4/U6 small nuclear ribonuclear protein [Trypanosoma theileri]ORC86190.1 putative U4/U6 small nuclear ribonuclear protein [Trypanosoma theileri]
MYQPLLELPPAATTVCAAGDRLLGEAAGVLYSSSQRAAYEAHGGAVYPSWKPANRNVVGRGTRQTTTTITTGGRSRKGGALYLWRQQSLKQLVRLLRPVVSFVPLLRLVLPFVVPASANCTPRLLLKSAEYPERVTAIAFHPHRMLLAAVVDEGAGSSRVVVYDVAESRERCVLTHAFQQHASCVAWKPFSRDVLAVGCDGGVLVWSLSFGTAPATTIYGGSNNNNNNNIYNHNNYNNNNGMCNTRGVEGEGEDQTAYCLFYRCTPHVRTTCINFSRRDGRYLACGSLDHIAVQFHDIRLPPSNALLLRHVSAEGGTEDVLFADDDTFAVRLVCGAARIVLLSFPSCASTTVATPAPVLSMAPARVFGPHHFVLNCARVEGVIVAHVNPFVGVAVVALISTGVHRGVGGSVRSVACSGRRMYIAVETGHVLVCHCGHRAGTHTLIPIGVVQLDVHKLAVFDGCTAGSLLAAVERDQTITFLPSYHA